MIKRRQIPKQLTEQTRGILDKNQPYQVDNRTLFNSLFGLDRGFDNIQTVLLYELIFSLKGAMR
jgi:hypothetical protein